MVPGKGWLAKSQLHGRDSQRPDVRLVVVSGFLNDFRSHPVGSTNKCIPLRFEIGQLRSDAKVCQLDLALVRQKDIGGLDVSMDLVGRMQVVEAEEELAADDGDVGFAEGAGFQLFLSALWNANVAHLLPGPRQTLRPETP